MDNAARVRILLGSTGSGKTYKFAELLNAETRIIVFDVMADEKLENYGVLVSSAQDLAELVMKTPKFRIRTQLDEEILFDFACTLAMKVGNITIAVDEVATFCSPNYMSKPFKDIIRLGRHKSVRFIGTTQRPPDISPTILAQAKEWYLFQMHLPRDVQYLKGFVPDIEKCQNLQTGQFILWKPGSQQPTTPTNPPSLNTPLLPSGPPLPLQPPNVDLNPTPPSTNDSNES